MEFGRWLKVGTVLSVFDGEPRFKLKLVAAVLDREPVLDRACSRLIDAANASGGLDNITVALVRVS